MPIVFSFLRSEQQRKKEEGKSHRQQTVIGKGHTVTNHIGTSGWSYDHWEGVLYPPRSPARQRLDHYVSRFRTVEVNSTYYHWPRDTTFAGWHERVPSDFLFTIKAPRGLTHSTRLYAPEKWIETMSRGLLALGSSLGVLLVQLPPAFECDYDRLAYFLEHLPDWLRVAVEFRHPSWNNEEVFALLERTQTAYCVMSGANLPCLLRATAPFVYVRLHGPDRNALYAGSYSDEELGWWRDRIQEWNASAREVFAYFNNDGEGNAVRNAETLLKMLNI
jgi:uncharacterized protein YecE (DUF72 family)